MQDSKIYLDTYLLQKDMRIRLPKAIVENLKVTKGETKFDIFYSAEEDSIILKIHNSKGEDNE